MRDIAYCILTYNHRDALELVLSEIQESFCKNNIDIYIFDSSEADDTKELVEGKQAQGADNLFYVECKDIHSGDEKYLFVIKNELLQRKYRYIWPSKDRTIISGRNLEVVRQRCNEGNDAVVFAADMNRSEYIYPQYNNMYTDMVELFRDYGALSGSWESVIFSSDFLLNIDWERYSKEYMVNERNPFNQPVIFYTRLSELKNPRVAVIHANPYERMYVAGVESTWIDRTMDIFGKQWPEAILALPNCYEKHKLDVIKKETMVPELFGSIDNLMFLYEKGILSKDSFDEIKGMWEFLSDIKREYVHMLINDDFDALIKSVLKDYNTALENNDIMKVIWLHKTNTWLAMVIGQEKYDERSKEYEAYLISKNETCKFY